MSGSPYSKHHASLNIEELLQQTDTRQPSWLLSYIDVFMLIIMLLLTLLALSVLPPDSEQQHMKPINSTANTKPTPTKKSSGLFTASTKALAIAAARQTPLPTQPRATQLDPDMLLQHPVFTDQNHKKNQSDSQSTPTENAPSPSTRLLKEDQSPAIGLKKSPVIKHEPADKFVQNNNPVQLQLQKMIDQLGLENAIKIRVSLGYAQVEIQDKVLFQSSTSQILPAGKSLLNKLTPLLIKSSGLIYIEGHTDNRPINTDRFPSNWELGSSRATRVLHLLSSLGLQASRLRAVSYGDTQPIADNATEQGREQNRRVNLVIKVSDTVD